MSLGSCKLIGNNIQYTDVKNPVWGNSEKTIIICEVNFSLLPEDFVPFSAVASGNYEHTHKIYAECLEGKYGEIGNYVPPPAPTTEQLENMIRSERNRLLSTTDWTQLPDVPQATKDLWAIYRQALRDITTQTGYPRNVVWPTQPR